MDSEFLFPDRRKKRTHFLENKEKQINPAGKNQTIVCNYDIPILKKNVCIYIYIVYIDFINTGILSL